MIPADPDDLADAIVPDRLPIEVLVGDLRGQILAGHGDLRGITRSILVHALIVTGGNLGVTTDAFLMVPRPRWLAHLIVHDGDHR